LISSVITLNEGNIAILRYAGRGFGALLRRGGR
jgi:hypothetical protein